MPLRKKASAASLPPWRYGVATSSSAFGTTADRESPPHRIAELQTDLERLHGELTRRERDAESLQREKSRLQRRNSRLQ